MFTIVICFGNHVCSQTDMIILYRLLLTILFLVQMVCRLTITQSCFLLGIKLTSATFSVTLQNVVPVFTFVIALMMR